VPTEQMELLETEEYEIRYCPAIVESFVRDGWDIGARIALDMPSLG
jgi:hypothetical protein